MELSKSIFIAIIVKTKRFHDRSAILFVTALPSQTAREEKEEKISRLNEIFTSEFCLYRHGKNRKTNRMTKFDILQGRFIFLL